MNIDEQIQEHKQKLNTVFDVLDNIEVILDTDYYQLYPDMTIQQEDEICEARESLLNRIYELSKAYCEGYREVDDVEEELLHGDVICDDCKITIPARSCFTIVHKETKPYCIECWAVRTEHLRKH